MMKKQFTIFSAAVLTLGLGSCSKSYFDINNNPNQATSASAQLVLPNALTTTASNQEVPFNFLSAWLGYLGQSGSYATGAGDIASYKQTTNSADGLWTNRYRNLADYDYIEKNAHKNKLPFYEAAAKIMKAFVFEQLVDMFNNIPYSQALQGTNIITPKYDDAQSVYNAITLQIDSAVILLGRPDAIGDKTYDVMFGKNFFGNSYKSALENLYWMKFANTLKLRILLRQSQVASQASFIQAEIAKITQNQAGFLDYDAGVNPGYSNNSGQQNPQWGFFVTLTGNPTAGGGADFWKANQYSITWLTNHNDPRLPQIYKPGGAGMVGSVLGSTNNPAGTNAATPGPGILQGVNQSTIIISAAQSYLMQAEADVRGLLGGNAVSDFDKGVQASFDYLGAGSSAAYVAQNDNQTNLSVAAGTSQQLACIMRQEWIADNQIDPFDAWSNYRRLHLPADLPLSISPFLDQSPASIPIRFLYPTSEYNNNTANVSAQGTIDYHKSPVFWNQ
ncbi:MAG TPA: SusD/RagB family nutrient-binding outer membrane lipoprotein [Puia sp.]|nr:SusD/RagB family nutrient-binding outer membrane lipoprotein [Puia sp.]